MLFRRHPGVSERFQRVQRWNLSTSYLGQPWWPSKTALKTALKMRRGVRDRVKNQGEI
jgi:hypothetical protein